jgi:hypothetical protein
MKQCEHDKNYEKEPTPIVGKKPNGKSRLRPPGNEKNPRWTAKRTCISLEAEEHREKVHAGLGTINQTRNVNQESKE